MDKSIVVIVLTVFGVLFSLLYFSEIQAAEFNPGCLSALQLRAKYDFPLYMPSYLPAGYDYKCGVADPGDATMLFWDQPVMTSEYELDTLSAATLSKGSILFGQTLYQDLENPAERRDEVYESIRGSRPDLSVELLEINGNPSWGYESKIVGADFTVNSSSGSDSPTTYFSELPAKLYIYEVGKQYRIEGFLPLSELIKVGDSLSRS